MAKESEDVINGLEKGREKSPGRINRARDSTAVIIPQVRQIHGHGKRACKQVQRDKAENPIRNVKE